jgi:hypothetical protein
VSIVDHAASSSTSNAHWYSCDRDTACARYYFILYTCSASQCATCRDSESNRSRSPGHTPLTSKSIKRSGLEPHWDSDFKLAWELAPAGGAGPGTWTQAHCRSLSRWHYQCHSCVQCSTAAVPASAWAGLSTSHGLKSTNTTF